MEATLFSFSSSQSLAFRSKSRSSLLFLRSNLGRSHLRLKFPCNFSVRASSNGNSVVTLLQYGAGNVRIVGNAIRYLGYDVKDVQTPEDILNANRLVFPEVGAFSAAMDELTERGWAEALSAYIKKDRPFLGICLGLQLLFEASEENGQGTR